MTEDWNRKLEDAFLPMMGKLVWSVRKGYGTFLTMEFGSPHLTIREPIAASLDASLKVRRNLAKRRVSIVGDWHFWIQYAQWEIVQRASSVRSQDVEVERLEEALRELDGQILVSATPGAALNSCVLKFDLGASLYIWPSPYMWPSPEIHDEQWSIFAIGGNVTSCDMEGNVIVASASI